MSTHLVDNCQHLLMNVLFTVRFSKFTAITMSNVIIIQEDLLKINKNMLKLIQLFTSAWRNKDTEKKGKKKNTSSCSLHSIHQTKNKTKKNKKKTKKKQKKLTHKYIQNKYECMMAAK